MRLLIIVLTLLLAVALLGFVLTNLDTRIDVNVWKTHHESVPLYLVVFLSVVAGVVYACIIGVGQGVQMWISNRRLTREIEKLETELNYFRTQPSIRTPPGEASRQDEMIATEPPGSEVDAEPLASAPVYGPDDDGDPDDDVYSGGRAV